MVASGYIIETVVFELWSLTICLLAAYQVFVLREASRHVSGGQQRSHGPGDSSTYRTQKMVNWMCLTTSLIGVVVFVDKRCVLGIYPVRLVSLLLLLMLCPLFAFGLLWFDGLIRVVHEAGVLRRFRIPEPIYVVIVIVDVSLTFLSWLVAVNLDRYWLTCFQVVFNVIIAIVCFIVTFICEINLELQFRRISTKLSAEHHDRHRSLSRKLCIALAVQLFVTLMGVMMLRVIVGDKEASFDHIVPDPNDYVFSEFTWTGAGYLAAAGIGVGLFWTPRMKKENDTQVSRDQTL
eukprot:TRINITY_DN77791_c0_g1_i1.p1 TRINITY_DN77791_c0_g1~~TRINITY_DN77791_c0_g1_i1.p1  ORF type:complete len:292 (-),score=54.32 TRINITY_DN77791_c0_g1_i1:617-1492(-)